LAKISDGPADYSRDNWILAGLAVLTFHVVRLHFCRFNVNAAAAADQHRAGIKNIAHADKKRAAMKEMFVVLWNHELERF
jgi:hypothetical protein